jgi:probable phosphoglycerate mutase
MEAKNIFSGKLILVRHGQSEWNKKGMCQGHLNSDLTGRGRGQAATFGWAVSRLIENMGLTHVRFVASPQDRTMQTARIMLEHGDTTMQCSSVEQDKRLMEGNMGIAQGKIIADWDDLMPEEAAHRKADKWRNRFPGGECYLDIHRRTLDFLNDNCGGNMVVVTHEMVSKCIRGIYSNLHQDDVVSLKHKQDVVYIIDRKNLTVEEYPVNDPGGR